MSKLVNEIKYGLDNFVKEVEPEDQKIEWDWETRRQYLNVIEILERENMKSPLEDLSIVHILRYLGQNDLEIPMEHNVWTLKCELMSSEFTVYYSKDLWFTVDLSRAIWMQDAHVMEDIHAMIVNMILLTSDAFNPNW